ncbi:MAG: FtsW/RodA/SpoVE family cell cycle protein, partial [Lachnospiraceae bacterium]|nr:FtsW/RodA/SpoVE family cell cycle protein [Lachnospiraceae bacterium]
MAVVLSAITKYLITTMCAIYTISCLVVFRAKTEQKRTILIDRQQFCMFAFHFASYLILLLQTKNLKVALFYLVQFIFFKAAIWLYEHIYKNCSLVLMNNMFFLLSIGFVMISRISFDSAIKQFVIAVGAYCISLIVPVFMEKMKWIPKLGYFYGIVGILFLGLVFVVGSTKNGSTNWIMIGSSFAIQPSEFVKILFVFFLAAMYAKARDLKQVIIVTCVSAVHVLILVMEKDLGGALLYFMMYIVVSYVATGRAVYFFGGLVGGSAAGGLAYLLFSHVRNRVAAWRNPWEIIETSGYQITQSLFAIAAGGWFGTGLTLGRPTDIPVVESDFIFAAIAEELGLIFAILLIIICLCVFITFMNIAVQGKKLFYKLVGMGLGTCYIFQVFLNIGGVTKFIPLTGVTLPFISYGGSSVVSSFLIIGIMQGLYGTGLILVIVF